MAHDHHRNGSGGSGRYYVDDTSRGPRKFYNQSHNYNTYSSYSSNPNPFPSSAPQTLQQHDQNMHNNQRRSSHHFIKRIEQQSLQGLPHQGTNLASNNNWYRRPHQNYRNSRPSSAGNSTRKEQYEDPYVRHQQRRNYAHNSHYQIDNNCTNMSAGELIEGKEVRESSSFSSHLGDTRNSKSRIDSLPKVDLQKNEPLQAENKESDIDSDTLYTPKIENFRINSETNSSKHSIVQQPHLTATPEIKSADVENYPLSTTRSDKEMSNHEEQITKLKAADETVDEIVDVNTPILNPDLFVGVDACIFPMKEVEYRYWILKHQSRDVIHKDSKYLASTKLESLSEYSFFDDLFLVFKQADAFILYSAMKEIIKIQASKKEKLIDEYIYRKYMWRKKCKYYDQQLERLYEMDTVKQQPTAEDVIEPVPPSKPTTSRRSRHHGDSVRTEAEFLEILASLEKEREKDPLIKAQFGAAIIPDMILDPIDKYALTRKINSNNLVTDKDGWAKRLITDAEDNFTEAEHARFCELYILHPKKFGRISVELGTLRTPEECVYHYYRTKKTTNYKQLLMNKNKRSKKKPAKKKKDKTKLESTVSDTSNQELEVPSSEQELKPSQPEENSHTNKRAMSDEVDVATKQRKVSEDAVTKIPIQNTDALVQSTVTALYVNEVNTETEENKKSRKTKKLEEKSHISSYWSVQDINSFPLLLQKHGADWLKIADDLGTKSATMVKNYFQRGLIDHPEWQNFLNILKTENTMTMVPSHEDGHIGPSLGYFYKPPASTTFVKPSTFNAIPPIMSTFNQKQPLKQQNSHFVPVTSTTHYYTQSLPISSNPIQSSNTILVSPVDKQQPNSSQIIQATVQSPVTQPRENMMNMPFILNAPSPAPPSALPNQLSPAYVPTTNDHSVSKHPNIMSLLNADDAPGPQMYESQSNFVHRSSFKPNIQNIMNSSPIQPKKDSADGTSGALDSSNPPSKPFTSGTSALDALARIAFERK